MGNPAVVFDTINPAYLPKQGSRKAAKTRGLARDETHKVLGILASWREKTANALQQYVTEFMNRSTKMHGLAVWQVREWSSQQADMTLKKISRGM